MRSIVRAIFISLIFYIRDLRSGSISWPAHVKSMGKISTTSFSPQNISIHCESCWLRSSVMTQATFFIGDPPKVIWGHLKSPTVFLRITFDPKEIETWEWSYCVFLIKTHRYICNMTYLGHHVTLTWGQILTLTFQGHAIHVSMRLDEANTMVSKLLLYHFKHGSYHRKTVSLKNAVFDLSWPLTPKPLVLGEIWRQLGERAFQELSIAFLNFDVAVTGTEIMRIIWSHVM